MKTKTRYWKRSNRLGTTMMELVISLTVASVLSLLVVEVVRMSGLLMSAISREVFMRERFSPTFRMMESALRESGQIQVFPNYQTLGAGNLVAAGGAGTCFFVQSTKFVPAIRKGIPNPNNGGAVKPLWDSNAADGILPRDAQGNQNFAFYSTNGNVYFDRDTTSPPNPSDTDNVMILDHVFYNASEDSNSNGLWNPGETGPWGFEGLWSESGSFWINVVGDIRRGAKFFPRMQVSSGTNLEAYYVRVSASILPRQ